MKVPLGHDATHSENHVGDEDFMGPESVEQKVVEHDKAAVALCGDLGEDFACGVVLGSTDGVNH